MAGFGLATLGIVGIIVVFIVMWVIASLSVYIAARIIGVQVSFFKNFTCYLNCRYNIFYNESYNIGGLT